jgi:hypothetical protein
MVRGLVCSCNGGDQWSAASPYLPDSNPYVGAKSKNCGLVFWTSVLHNIHLATFWSRKY